VILLTFLTLFFLAPPGGPTVTGLWRTIDDKTGEPRGMVRIYQKDGQYYGRVEGIVKPEERHKLCVPCTDERKNQPVMGLVVLRRMKLRRGEFGGGDILDPETGSVYRCKLRLVDGGRKLKVRGYIGFSLLGRTQTWIRAGD